MHSQQSTNAFGALLMHKYLHVVKKKKKLQINEVKK